MRKFTLCALFVAAPLLLAAMGFKLVATAAVAPNATYSATTDVAQTPNQAVRWQITVGTAGTMSRMTMSLQPEMLQGVAASSLRVVTTLPAGTLTPISGGLQYTLKTPAKIAAGTRVWMTVQGITTPAAGTWASTANIYANTGSKLATGTATLTEKAPAICRTTARAANYIQQENALPGTTGWQIDENAAAGQVSNKLAAYAENPSVKCGDIINLRVNDLDINTLSISAYRLGYYNGAGARQIWQSSHGPWLIGTPQPAAQLVTTDSTGATVNMVTAKNWSRSFSIRVDDSWTPGSYLLAIRTSNGQGRYVPIVVRDDAGSHAQKVILNSAEWQAYNKYGGYDAYTVPQSKRISFDRPYLQHAGAGNLLAYEYGYIYWGEKQSLDLGYVMDTDVFGNVAQLDNQHMIALIGHPEYWTVDAAQHLAGVRASGTNILSLTANALYWRIKMAPSTLSGPNREYIITKDPGTDTDTFRMGNLPEQAILGAQYACANSYGNGVADTGWLWTNVVPGTQVPDLIGIEADEQVPGWPKANGAVVVQSVPLYAHNCVWDASLGGVARNAPGCTNVPSACAWDPNMTAANIMIINGIPGGRVFHASSINWASTLLQSPAAGQATLNAIAFLQNGLAPPPATSPSGMQATSVNQQDKLAHPAVQKTGPLSPPLPAFARPDDD